jgi:hypothetical protein
MKPDKGHENGSCNRTSCQDSPAEWWNHGSHSWYCGDCRHDIGFDHVNQRSWQDLNSRMKTRHPMFETRNMMNKRELGPDNE